MLEDLRAAAFTYPAIDNHAHALLRAENRADIPFEGLISESHLDGEAAIDAATHTLACYRATEQLGELFGLERGVSWEGVKAKRAKIEYTELAFLSTTASGSRRSCMIYHGTTNSPTVRPNESSELSQWLRYETGRRLTVSALSTCGIKVILQKLLVEHGSGDSKKSLLAFTDEFKQYLSEHAQNSGVVAFKSVVCYRSGLAVTPKFKAVHSKKLRAALSATYKEYKNSPKIRLQAKPLNDYVVHLAMEIIQFHTGLGDVDMMLDLSSPKHLQPLIKAYPNTKVVLLHSSYPYAREAGYLAAIHPNVYLDFGEIFPAVSAHGQRAMLQHILELAPTNKIMWSTDGHFWPESYYLGTIQAREALYTVLRAIVDRGELSEAVAVNIVQGALFHNANKLYKLNLVPNINWKK
ncbi:hypothetical protein DXG01_003636 [Tephrocybe rancida]|nr:hypothetical protein DXG01_003636 [Tephrocybe rancida]